MRQLCLQTFYGKLILVGLLYHLYNQFAFNTLGRVSPVSHGVCNVVKRICIIGASVLFFGNKLSVQTQVGTVVALAGAHPCSFVPGGALSRPSGFHTWYRCAAAACRKHTCWICVAWDSART